MRVKLIENTGDIPPVYAKVQEEIVNRALAADSGEALLTLMQHPINWNLLEVVDEDADKRKDPEGQDAQQEKKAK